MYFFVFGLVSFVFVSLLDVFVFLLNVFFLFECICISVECICIVFESNVRCCLLRHLWLMRPMQPTWRKPYNGKEAFERSINLYLYLIFVFVFVFVFECSRQR